MTAWGRALMLTLNKKAGRVGWLFHFANLGPYHKIAISSRYYKKYG
jgi:hypothetical protein